MKITAVSNKTDTISGFTIAYKEEKAGHFAVKLIKCCIGFIMFEWVAGQTFTDVIGMNVMDSFLIGVAFFLLYLIMAVKFKEDLVESMF